MLLALWLTKEQNVTRTDNRCRSTRATIGVGGVYITYSDKFMDSTGLQLSLNCDHPGSFVGCVISVSIMFKKEDNTEHVLRSTNPF